MATFYTTLTEQEGRSLARSLYIWNRKAPHSISTNWIAKSSARTFGPPEWQLVIAEGVLNATRRNFKYSTRAQLGL